MKLRKAFTLIELLVVIAIIALLLSILMPSLQKVKKQAQAVVDRSNLKQLTISLAMYNEDNDSKFWTGYDWQNEANSRWWMPALIQYAGEIPKIRFCPAAKKLRTNKNGSPGVGRGKEPFTAWGHNTWLDDISIRQGYKNCDTGSYAVNGWIEDRPDHLTDDDPATKPWFWRKSTTISQAERVPFLVDAQWIDVWPRPNFGPPNSENGVWNGPGAVSQMDRIVQNRHNGHVNVVFMDGSSRLVGLKELWTLKWHREYNTGGMWTKASGSTPSWPDWMDKFKDY